MIKLTPALNKFVLHWGEMGARWGVNRTVAQIHALLYIAPEPMTADEIITLLSVARSNVSSAVRELQKWGLVKVVHSLGDRRDRYQAVSDVWRMFELILEERKRREVDPALAALRECVEESRNGKSPDGVSEKRLCELLSFFETATGWYEDIKRLPHGTLLKAMRMGRKLLKLLEQGS